MDRFEGEKLFGSEFVFLSVASAICRVWGLFPNVAGTLTTARIAGIAQGCKIALCKLKFRYPNEVKITGKSSDKRRFHC